MTLEKYKTLQAAWLALCVALVGGGLGFMINWQFGLLAAGVAALGVWALLAGKDGVTEWKAMEDGDEIPSVESDSSRWNEEMNDAMVTDPAFSSLAGNVWHHE